MDRARQVTLFVPKRYFNEDGLECRAICTSAVLGTPFTQCIPNRLCFICDQIVVIILIISLYKRISYLGNRFESDLETGTTLGKYVSVLENLVW